jgi:hypothetical protein
MNYTRSYSKIVTKSRPYHPSPHLKPRPSALLAVPLLSHMQPEWFKTAHVVDKKTAPAFRM